MISLFFRALNDAITDSIKFIDANNNKIPFMARITVSHIVFTNGVGQVSVATEGHALSSNAFAVGRESNASLSVAYAKGNSSNNTVTVGLTNTGYNGGFTFAVLYFLS